MGEAKRRGTYEERKAEALRRPKTDLTKSMSRVIERVTRIHNRKLAHYINVLKKEDLRCLDIKHG